MKKPTVIVGGGIFGSIAAGLAVRRGARVVVVNPCVPEAASPAAACLIKPSWLSSLNKDQIATGYGVLRGLYGVETLPFNDGLISIDWVPPQKILDPLPEVEYAPQHIAEEVGDGWVKLSNGDKLKGKILVAAGVYSQYLVDMPPVRSLMGLSLIFKGTMPPRMKVYAPYKQAIAFNVEKESIWFGNGVSILRENWDTSAQLEKAVAQAKKLFGLDGPFSYQYGARPYVEGHKAGYFAKIHNNTWVSTGGAKNGTILAAYQAAKFVEEAL